MGEITVHEPQQFYAGDDWEIAVQCTNADGTPMSLDGASVEWKLDDATGQTNVLTLTQNDGVIIDVPVTGDPQPGTCVVFVSAARSSALAAGFYLDQLSVVTNDGIHSTQFRGRIEVVGKLA